MCFVLIIVFWLSFNTILFSRKNKTINQNKIINLLMLISVNAIGVLIYGINRAVYAFVIIAMYQFLLTVALSIDYLSNVDNDCEFVKNSNCVLRELLLAIITILAIESVFYLGYNMYIKTYSSWQTDVYKYEEKELKEIRENCSKRHTSYWWWCKSNICRFGMGKQIFCYRYRGLK